MLARIAIPIVAFIAWCFVCQHWYVCHIKQKCGEPEPVVVAPPAEPAPDNRPLVFNWSDPTTVTRDSWGAYRDSTLANLGEGQILEIVGLYSKDEPAPEGFPNMGMARAAKIKDLLADYLSDEQVLMVSRLVNLPDDAQTNLFEAANFNFLDETDEEVAEIVEVDDRIIIQFPFSSAKKEPDPKVDAYLEKLAERLKTTEESVSITGHTDNVGGNKMNMNLGRARARHIRKILVRKGIERSRISIDSKGEEEPVADNATEAGRRKNRRAELQLNQ